MDQGSLKGHLDLSRMILLGLCCPPGPFLPGSSACSSPLSWPMPSFASPRNPAVTATTSGLLLTPYIRAAVYEALMVGQELLYFTHTHRRSGVGKGGFSWVT